MEGNVLYYVSKDLPELRLGPRSLMAALSMSEMPAGG